MSTLTNFIPADLTAAIERARAQVEHELRHNERAVWLVATSLFVLYFAFVLFLANNAGAAKSDYMESETRFARLTGQIRDIDWTERATTAQARAQEAKSAFWPGDTPGLAEAAFERWIRLTFGELGLEVRQVRLTRSPLLDSEVGSVPESLEHVQVIKAKVIAPLKEDALVQFLSRAAEHPELLVVDQLVIRGGRDPRLELDLHAFFAFPGQTS